MGATGGVCSSAIRKIHAKWNAICKRSMIMKRTYDSTVARIAGNLLSGDSMDWIDENVREFRVVAAATARAIVAEVERTEPEAQ